MELAIWGSGLMVIFVIIITCPPFPLLYPRPTSDQFEDLKITGPEVISFQDESVCSNHLVLIQTLLILFFMLLILVLTALISICTMIGDFCGNS